MCECKKNDKYQVCKGPKIALQQKTFLILVCDSQVWVCQGGTVKVEQGGVQEYRRRVVKAFS